MPAVVDLLEGRIDALAPASAPEALMVQILLLTPGITLFDFAQAEACSRRFAFIIPVLLPRGVVDLARDLPASDVRLVAPEAARLYRNGGPWLQPYLPFWLVNVADCMWVVLGAIVALLIPRARVVPPLCQFRIRSRVFRWYARLQRSRASRRVSCWRHTTDRRSPDRRSPECGSAQIAGRSGCNLMNHVNGYGSPCQSKTKRAAEPIPSWGPGQTKTCPPTRPPRR